MAKTATPKGVKAVSFTVWSVNGELMDEEVVSKLEEAIEATIFEAFNNGHRLLTQTNKG